MILKELKMTVKQQQEQLQIYISEVQYTVLIQILNKSPWMFYK